MIVSDVENVIVNRPFEAFNEFTYGKRVTKPAKILTEIIIQAFKQLGIDFSVKSNKLCN